MSKFPVTLYHNPACPTSRRVLALIEAHGHLPTIVRYLETGWTRDRLEALFHAMHLRPRDLLRRQSPLAAELGLLEEGVSDERILVAMVHHPELVERPIVTTPLGTRLCRPAEQVESLLGA
ncbi:MAG TPA: arsenate reductase (glutaredoxin) [Acidisoma sp.]|uniref:arsenate reductase (glutaredoxin) n=1 Tax=Acidisoma sp. TaxID=1872115 RepID=UPI002BF40C88|nr:arsenate reductase (glutaredoxin) [Acidisoma sp.]HTH99366.1 arsenate reductase (glutaredoxin) [Acidisoma sp.]